MHAGKGKSAHDLLEDERLSAAPAVTKDELGLCILDTKNIEN